MQPSPPTSPSSPRRRPLTPAQPPGRRSTGRPSPAPRRTDGTPPQRRVRTPEGRPQASLSRPRVGRLHAVDRRTRGRTSPAPRPRSQLTIDGVRRSVVGPPATSRADAAAVALERDRLDAVITGLLFIGAAAKARRARPGTRRGWRPGARGRRARRRGGGARPGQTRRPPPVRVGLAVGHGALHHQPARPRRHRGDRRGSASARSPLAGSATTRSSRSTVPLTSAAPLQRRRVQIPPSAASSTP